MKDYIITCDNIYCNFCKSKLTSRQDLIQTIIYYTYFNENDTTYLLMCDFCKKDRKVDIIVEVIKDVFLKEDEYIIITYFVSAGKKKLEDTKDVKLYVDLPTNAPYFKKELLIGDYINIINIKGYSLDIKNEGKEHCVVTLIKLTNKD